MSQTYAFMLPRKVVAKLPIPTTRFLVLITLLWLLIYGWLGYRLLIQGVRTGWFFNLLLSAVIILLGVLLALSWRRVGWRWWRGFRQGGKWRALSVAAMYQLNPSEFEDYVAHRLFARQGYHVLNTPDSKDGGIDVLVTDDYGRQAVVQCKRYKGTVGSATVRELYGVMIHTGAARAYLVTTGEISEDACRWAEGKPLILIDGAELERLSRTAPGLQKI